MPIQKITFHASFLRAGILDVTAEIVFFKFTLAFSRNDLIIIFNVKMKISFNMRYVI